MKKALSAVLAVVLVLGVCFSVPMIASANDANDFTYRLNKDGDGYIITGVKDVDDVTGEVTIPKEYTLQSGEGFDEDGNVITITNPTNVLDANAPTVTLPTVEGADITATYLAADAAEGTDPTEVTAESVPATSVVTVTVDVTEPTKEVDTVTVTNTTTPEETVTVTDNEDGTYTFTMPAGDVTVAVTLKDKEVTPEPEQPTKYNVTLNDINEIVTLGVPAGFEFKAEADDTVTVYVTSVGKNYVVTGISVTYGENSKVENVTPITENLPEGAIAGYTFAMPAADVSVSADYVNKYNAITVDDSVKAYIKVEGTKTDAGYEYGTDVTVTVDAPNGYALKTLTVNGGNVSVDKDNEYTFKMLGQAVTITAEFQAAALPIVGIDEGAFAGCSNITAFKLAADQTNFTVPDGVLVAGTTLLAFPANYGTETDAEETYTIPAAVTKIAKNAFEALGAIDYVFYNGNIETLTVAEGNTALTETVFHKGMPSHTEDKGTTTDETCMQKGETVYKCEVCKKLMRTEEIDIDKTAHDMGEWYTETAATCAADGVMKRVCTNLDADGKACTHFETQTIPATNKHVADEGTILEGDEPTCTEDGLKTYYCRDCKIEVVKEETLPATGHSLTDPDERKLPTCTEDGYEKGLCDNCSEKYEVVFEAKGHTMITIVDAKATCTVPGSKHQECEVCGYMDEDAVIETIPALGHSKAEETAWTIVTEATCSETGLLQKFCDTCHTPLTDAEGKEITRVLEATGEHEYKDYKETKAPTCTEKGEETGTCACGATDVQEIDAKGHTWAEDFTTDKEATCTEKGSKSIHCTAEGCKETKDVTEIPVKAHTADDTWTTVQGKAATCYAEGEKTGTCTVCKTENCVLPIEKLAHTWAETAVAVEEPIEVEVQKVDEDGKLVVDEDGEPVMETITYAAATCEADGYTVKYCTVENCDAYDEASLTKVAKLEHNWAAYPQGVTATAKVDPTCTTDGKEYKYCDRDCCKREVEIKIPTTGHSWASSATVLTQSITVTDEDGNETTYNAPSCKGEGTDGYKAVFCTVAGCNGCKDFEVVKAPAHVPEFTQWTAGTAATCLKKATETNVCVNCDDPLTREVGELAAHDYSETKTTVYPTCEEDGVEYYACKQAGCEAKDQEKVLEALGHDHADDAEFVGTEATCLTDGVKVKACRRLFNADGSLYEAPSTDENDTPSTGDSNASGDTGSTVAEGDGVNTETPATPVPCEGAKQVTKATGHAFSDEYTVDTKPTCTQDGEKSRHCTNKGCTEKTNILPVKALDHEYGETYTVDTKPTCSSVGYESIHCTRYADCKTKKAGTTREIPKSHHTYDDVNGWVVKDKATCTEKGSKYNDCKVCGEAGRKTDEIAALGHDISTATLKTEAATCLDDGKTYKLCERYVETETGVVKCGAEVLIEELKATGHNVADDGWTITAANCTTAGSKTGTCQNANCPNEGKTVTETIPATGHKFDTQPTRTEPTCTQPGRLTGTCSVCELENVYNEIEPKGHTWGDWELAPVAEDAEADCTVQGGMIRYCTVANCDGSELGKNDEHTVSSWIIGTKATCGTAGEMHTECKVCAKVIETEAIAATGKHDLKETVTLEPTCNEKGSKTVECQAKDCTYTDTVEIPATGHSYTEWKVFVEPTCTTKGIRQSVCEVCLTTQSEKILALGHDLGEYIVDAPAVCGKAGSQHKECSRCDYKTDAETIKALDHKFVGNDCANKCGAKIYEYALVEGSTTDIIITKYNGSDENLVIPAEIDGYKVVAIGNRAFMKTEIVPGTPATETTEATEDTINYIKSDFVSLTIPASITTIGDYAFANSKLALVNIPATVTTIGKCAFGYDVVITMVEPDVEEGETPAEDDDEVKLVENIVPTKVANFTIYGVKGSAAETYAKQDAAEGEEYNFTFVEVKDVYEVVVDEEATNIEKVEDGVLFKEFITEDIDENTPAPSIEDQIKAIVVLEDNSTYEVAVEASQTYKDNDDATPDLKFYGTGTKVLVKDGAGNVVDEIVIIVEGDVNGDSVVDAIDCMLIQLATKDAEVLDGVYYTAGNITADSAITADDLNQAVLKIFGEDLVEEESTTEPTTQAPTTEPTTEPTTQAPSTEPSTEGTSDEEPSVDASEDASEGESESTTQKVEESDTTTTKSEEPSVDNNQNGENA